MHVIGATAQTSFPFGEAGRAKAPPALLPVPSVVLLPLPGVSLAFCSLSILADLPGVLLMRVFFCCSAMATIIKTGRAMAPFGSRPAWR
ncbi:hypothetical protein ACR9GN_24370, partial [Enterobacter ludwigii]